LGVGEGVGLGKKERVGEGLLLGLVVPPNKELGLAEGVTTITGTGEKLGEGELKISSELLEKEGVGEGEAIPVPGAT
jgi:hypothetical protein